MPTPPVGLAEAGSGFLQQVALGPLLSRFAVDEVGATERAGALAKRSIKKESKVAALRLAVAVMDLTTLEGADTLGKVPALCCKGPPARPPRPLGPAGARRLRLPVTGRDRPRGPGRVGGQGGLGGHRLPQRSG